MTGHLLMVDDQIVRTMVGRIGMRFSSCLGSNGWGVVLWLVEVTGEALGRRLEIGGERVLRVLAKFR